MDSPAPVLSPEDLRAAFQEMERHSLKTGRLLMNIRDAVDLGYMRICHRCGVPVLAEAGYSHPRDECDGAMVALIMES